MNEKFEGDDDMICIWNIGDSSLMRTIKDHEATIFSIAFSPDGEILLTSDATGKFKAWSSQPAHNPVLANVDDAHDLGMHNVKACFVWKA